MAPLSQTFQGGTRIGSSRNGYASANHARTSNNELSPLQGTHQAIFIGDLLPAASRSRPPNGSEKENRGRNECSRKKWSVAPQLSGTLSCALVAVPTERHGRRVAYWWAQEPRSFRGARLGRMGRTSAQR